MTWDAKARARHRLESLESGPSESRDSDDSEARPVDLQRRAEAEEPLGIFLPQPLRFTRADPIYGAARLTGYFLCPLFVMGNFL
jgi:hypothetical protein